MSDNLVLHYKIPRDDFSRAGEASSKVKKELKLLGVDSGIIRKVSIALYEGEINMVIHANGGEITVEISPDKIHMVLEDTGPGIKDVEQAMQSGFSTAAEEARELGFGAGMGLPNMKNNTDNLNIDTTVGVGTTITMDINM